ncbi:MAG: hypothetical protein AMJ53_14410, partial [Gammaproteobacteria bacterium SG8_11]
MKRPGIFNARKFRQMRNKQRKEKQLASRKAEFETFEPRLLLSADLSPVTTDFNNQDNSGITLLLDAPELANETPVVLTDVIPGKSNESSDSDSTLLFNQLVFLDLDGAQDVVYEGPITIEDVDVAAFAAPDSLTDQTDDIIDAMLAELNEDFAGFGVEFTTDSPLDGVDFSTIYIGGDGAAFSEYGSFIGLSEKVDQGNLDKTDKAFVFADNIEFNGLSASAFGQQLAEIVAHETGHLLGFEHAHNVESDASSALDKVAWKPYSHVEMAKDVREDLMQDGKLTIAGNDYDVHPLILQAIEKYPSYYYAGAVGPDGFPDMVVGQGTIHPNSTGVWVSHILDTAWQAQTMDKYTEAEKSQFLAFAYGYATHTAGDTLAHSMVNAFSDGPFPEILKVVSEREAFENAMRHNIIEAYLMTANPGYNVADPHTAEGDINREGRIKLANGDVSYNQSPGIEFDAPNKFIYEALTKNMPDLPGQVDYEQFNIDATNWADGGYASLAEVVADLNAAAAADDNSATAGIRALFDQHAQLIFWQGFNVSLSNVTYTVENPLTNDNVDITLGFGGLELESDATVEVVKRTEYASPADVVGTEKTIGWKIKSGYTEFFLRETTDSIVITEVGKSRGQVVDPIIALRDLLFQFKNSTLFKNSFYDLPAAVADGSLVLEPFRPIEAIVDRVTEGAERALRGEGPYTQDMLLDDLQSVWSEVENTFAPVAQKVAVALYDRDANGDIDLGKVFDALAEIANLAGGAAAAPVQFVYGYIDYWVNNIDEALMNWSDLGLAISKLLFDPQTTRDLQNQAADGYGADVANVKDGFDKRAEKEAEVNQLEVLLREIDDPNHDGKTDESYINQHLISMFGMPKGFGELRATYVDILSELDQKVLEPIRGLAPAVMEQIDKVIDYLLKDVREWMQDVIDEEVKKRFGVDLDVLRYIEENAENFVSLEKLSIQQGQSGTPQEFKLFKAGSREKLDSFMGFTGDFFEELDQEIVEVQLGDDPATAWFLRMFYQKDSNGKIRGKLKENVEFDKQKFSPFADSQVLSKLLLLQETTVKGVDDVLPGKYGSSAVAEDPKTISKLISDLIDQPYDFSKMRLNGNHGGNILTATMPGVVDEFGNLIDGYSLFPNQALSSGDNWMTAIDYDLIFRANAETETTLHYQHTIANREAVENPDPAPNFRSAVTEWMFEVTPGQSYSVQVDWLTNNQMKPATNAIYSIFDGLSTEAIAVVGDVDQRRFPDGTRGDGVTKWVEGEDWLTLILDTGAITSGFIRVELSAGSGNSHEESVVAGRVRVENTENPDDTRTISKKSGLTPRSDNELTESYRQIAAHLFTVPNSPDVDAWVAELNTGVIPLGLQQVFADNGETLQGVKTYFNPDAIPPLSPFSEIEDTEFAQLKVISATKWQIVDIEPVHPVEPGALPKSHLTKTAERYTVELIAGELVVTAEWQNISYPSGAGNFPLWEAASLRNDAFRKLFRDWMNDPVDYDQWQRFHNSEPGSTSPANNFPDLGDTTTDDTFALAAAYPVGSFLSLSDYTRPATLAYSGSISTAHTLSAGPVDLLPQSPLGPNSSYVDYDGDGQTNDLLLDNVHLVNSGVGGVLTIDATAQDVDKIIIRGVVAAIGYDKLEIRTTGEIIVEDGALLSTRNIDMSAATVDFLNAPSLGTSANVALAGSSIYVGHKAAILTNANGTHQSGYISGQASLSINSETPNIRYSPSIDVKDSAFIWASADNYDNTTGEVIDLPDATTRT